MKVYISGPISGYDLDERRELFANAAKAVAAELECETVNPMEVVPGCEYQCDPGQLSDAPPYIHTWKCWMKYDIIAMMVCDAIVMLPGWEDSNGARLERNIAASLNYKIYYMDHGGCVSDE